jgi:hypothetical protein
MDPSHRSFTVEKSEVAIPSESTRYISRTPAGAAAKAARRIFAGIKNANKTEVRFTIRETTQGSVGKMYRYIGIREKLDKPKIVVIAGKEVPIRHKFTVKSCRIDK